MTVSIDFTEAQRQAVANYATLNNTSIEEICKRAILERMEEEEEDKRLFDEAYAEYVANEDEAIPYEEAKKAFYL